MKKNDKRLKNLRPIKKGQCLNPKGRAAGVSGAVRALTREHIAEVGALLLRGTEDELETYCEANGITMLHKLLARVLRKGANRGDVYAMEKFLEQVAGHIPKEVKVKLSAHAQLVNMVNEAESDEDDLDDFDLNVGDEEE